MLCECDEECGETADLIIAFGCPDFHTTVMTVCEDCGDLIRDYARGNTLECGECDRLCIEFLEQEPGGPTTGIAMAGNPGDKNCGHRVVTAGICFQCGQEVPDPSCRHSGTLTPVYTVNSGAPASVMCHDCGRHLTRAETSLVCDHQFTTQIGGNPPAVQGIKCGNCGLTPAQVRP